MDLRDNIVLPRRLDVVVTKLNQELQEMDFVFQYTPSCLATLPLHNLDFRQFLSLEVKSHDTIPCSLREYLHAPKAENGLHATNAFPNETYQTNYYTCNLFLAEVMNHRYEWRLNIARE